MKKKVIASVLAIVLVLGLTACGGASNGKPKNDKVTLQFWGWGDDVEASVFQEITDKFNETVGKEKNISVKYVQKASSSYSSDAALALSGNNTPDIVYVEETYVKSWADAGYLTQLDSGEFKGFDQPLIIAQTIVPHFTPTKEWKKARDKTTAKKQLQQS